MLTLLTIISCSVFLIIQLQGSQADILNVEENSDLSTINFNPSEQFSCADVNFCSHNGRCIGRNRCDCEKAFGGIDCSEYLCEALNNCSGNGECIGPNTCKCSEGWQSADCSIPTCYLLNNCTDHGKCIAPNQCLCQPQYQGAECSERTPNCTETNCKHGICIDDECQCNDGWSGSECRIPLCDKVKNCSNMGVCIAPNNCQCYIGMSGDDCSVCVPPICNRCPFRCIHGECDMTRNECNCWRGWKGLSCEVCHNSTCEMHPTSFFVFPSSVTLQQTGYVVSVYGNYFPFSETGQYTCMFGTVPSEGHYLSAALVKCSIPRELKADRYPIYIIPYGSNSIIPTLNNKPIYVTVYNRCNPSECEGICLGMMCICPINREGDLCEKIKIGSNMHKDFAANESFTVATEGLPYTVKLPMKDINVVFNAKSDIANLSVSPGGLVIWQKPIGRETPYYISVNIETPNGESQISWNLTVQPSYTPKILKTICSKDSNQRIIQGTILTENQNVLGEVPVRVLIYRNNEKLDDRIIESKSDGSFEYIFHPLQEPSTYSAVAYHPGVTINYTENADNRSITWDEPEVHVTHTDLMRSPSSSNVVDTVYRIESTTEKPIGCRVEVMFPRDKMELTVIKEVQLAESNSSTILNASFTVDELLDSCTTIIQLYCLNTPKHIIRQKYHGLSTHPSFISDITQLNIDYSPQTIPSIIPIRFFNNGVELQSPVTILIEPANSPLFVTATMPKLSDYKLYSAAYSELVLYLTYRTGGVTFGEVIDGNITVMDNTGHGLANVSYKWKSSTSNFFNLNVYVQDEFTAMNLAKEVQGAEIKLRNAETEVSEQRRIIKSGNSVFFSVVEDVYELCISSPIHQTVRLIVQPTPKNCTITVFLPLLTSEQPIIHNQQIQLEQLYNTRNVPSPTLHFTPSTLTTTTNNYILLKSYSDSNRSFIYFPGFYLNDNQAPFQLKIEAAKYGLGSGDGYSIGFKLTKNSSLSSNETCSKYLLMIPYIYSIPGTKSNFFKESPLIVDLQKSDADDQLCQVSKNYQPKELETVWQKTIVKCDCRSSEIMECRQKYSSAAVCGDSWRWILDNNISYDSLAMFILLSANCNSAGGNFTAVVESLKCLSNFEMKCPVLSNKNLAPIVQKSVSNIDALSSFQIFLQQVSSVSDNFGSITRRFFNGFSALEGQAISMLGIFLSFFHQLQNIFPNKLFAQVNSRQWYDKFFAAVAETSDGGALITPQEYRILNPDNTSLDLIYLWNTTVTKWSLSDLEPKAGISFSATRNLLLISDRLKSLTKQYGASDPFTLLHKNMAVIISEANNNEPNSARYPNGGKLDVCGEAYLLATPNLINEDESFYVKLRMKNEKNVELSNFFVSLELIREHPDSGQMQFRVGPLTIDGISSIDGANALGAGLSFEAQWTVKVIGNTRLIRATKVEVVITVQFTVNGKQTLQQLESQVVRILPRPSLTLRYLLVPDVPLLRSSDAGKNYSASIDFINTGQLVSGTTDLAVLFRFSKLWNIKVEQCRILITGINGSSNIPFSIDGIFMGDDWTTKLGSNFVIPSIEPGGVVNIKYNFSTKFEPGRLGNLELFVSVANRIVHLDEPQLFYIHKVISLQRLLLTSYFNPKLLYYYDVARSTVHRILEPALIEVTDERRTVNDKEYRKQIAKFEAVSTDTTGASYYFQLAMPRGMPDNYEVLAVCHTPVGSGGHQRHIPPVDFLGKRNQEEIIYFIDEQPSYTEPELVYEFIYGFPEDFAAPVFEFSSYNIPLIKENWPTVNCPVARIGATSSTNLRITFNMYTSDAESFGSFFRIKPNTGDIMLTKELPRTRKNYCFTVSATDAAGRRSITPVLISTDSIQNDASTPCRAVDNIDDATPLLYSDRYQPDSRNTVISAISNLATTTTTTTTTTVVATATTATTTTATTTTETSVTDYSLPTNLSIASSSRTEQPEITTSTAVFSEASESFLQTSEQYSGSTSLSNATSSSLLLLSSTVDKYKTFSDFTNTPTKPALESSLFTDVSQPILGVTSTIEPSSKGYEATTDVSTVAEVPSVHETSEGLQPYLYSTSGGTPISENATPLTVNVVIGIGNAVTDNYLSSSTVSSLIESITSTPLPYTTETITTVTVSAVVSPTDTTSSGSRSEFSSVKSLDFNARTETSTVSEFISSLGTTLQPDFNTLNYDSDSQKQSEMACKLKGTNSIWGVICDLSKTAQSRNRK